MGVSSSAFKGAKSDRKAAAKLAMAKAAARWLASSRAAAAAGQEQQ
jgi:hypothetical protein